MQLPEQFPFKVTLLDGYLENLKSQVFYQEMTMDEIIEESMFSHRAFRFLLLQTILKNELWSEIHSSNIILGTRIRNTFNFFFLNEEVGKKEYKSQVQQSMNWEVDSSVNIDDFIFANKGIRKDALDLWKDLTVYRLHCWKSEI